MEPTAIWIYHPDGRSSYERITPQDANAKGWAILPDFSDLGEKTIELPSEAIETPSEVKIESQFVCDVCGKVCGNALGLSAHKRSHK